MYCTYLVCSEYGTLMIPVLVPTEINRVGLGIQYNIREHSYLELWLSGLLTLLTEIK